MGSGNLIRLHGQRKHEKLPSGKRDLKSQHHAPTANSRSMLGQEQGLLLRGYLASNGGTPGAVLAASGLSLPEREKNLLPPAFPR